MFARNVSIHLKSNMLSDYTRTLENETLPLLRKQKGFKDEITLSNPGSQDAISISLWENKASADAYNTNLYPMTRTRINWYFLGSLLAYAATAAAWVAGIRWALR